MKMFSDCAGLQCCICECGDFCLAGNGDDDFSLASKEQIIKRLNEGGYNPAAQQYMIDCLEKMFGYKYLETR